MDILDKAQSLVEMAAGTGNAALAAGLRDLQVRVAELVRQLRASQSQVAEMRSALEHQQTAPAGVFARRCPRWRELLRDIAGPPAA